MLQKFLSVLNLSDLMALLLLTLIVFFLLDERFACVLLIFQVILTKSLNPFPEVVLNILQSVIFVLSLDILSALFVEQFVDLVCL